MKGQSKEVARICRINHDGSGLDGPLTNEVQERISYSHEIPYSIVWQTSANANSNPHYSNNTFEIVITFDLKGIFVLGEKIIKLSGKDVLFVPPGMMHSSKVFETKTGSLINLKFDFQKLKESVDIERMLAYEGYCVSYFLYCQADYAETVKALEALIEADDNHFQRIARVVDLFEVWERGIQTSGSLDSSVYTDRLNELIRWTRSNYMNHITIDDAASIAHMSRSYFCKYFKEHINITYMDYLNRLRINHASIMLLNGMNASEVSIACGFNDLAYFIQLFKKYTGYTTREFVKNNMQIKSKLRSQSL